MGTHLHSIYCLHSNLYSSPLSLYHNHLLNCAFSILKLSLACIFCLFQILSMNKFPGLLLHCFRCSCSQLPYDATPLSISQLSRYNKYLRLCMGIFRVTVLKPSIHIWFALLFWTWDKTTQEWMSVGFIGGRPWWFFSTWECQVMAWRDDSVVTSTYCSCRGWRCGSQHPMASYNVYNPSNKRSEILFYITSAQDTLWCPYIYEHKTLRHWINKSFFS